MNTLYALFPKKRSWIYIFSFCYCSLSFHYFILPEYGTFVKALLPRGASQLNLPVGSFSLANTIKKPTTETNVIASSNLAHGRVPTQCYLHVHLWDRLGLELYHKCGMLVTLSSIYDIDSMLTLHWARWLFLAVHVQTCTQNQWAMMCAYLFHPIFGGLSQAAANSGASPVSGLSKLSAFGISRIPSKVLQAERDEWHLSSRAARRRVGSRADRKVSSEQGTSMICRFL